MVTNRQIDLLVAKNTETLLQLRTVLRSLAQSSYTQLNKKGNASVGQHVRHTLEFYQCLLQAKSVVNYDLRKRDLLIESSASYAVVVLEEVLNALSRFEQDKNLESISGIDQDAELQLSSSLARELFYVLEHAIHHMALIKVLIKDIDPQFELDSTFGVAYSTLAHRAKASS